MAGRLKKVLVGSVACGVGAYLSTCLIPQDQPFVSSQQYLQALNNIYKLSTKKDHPISKLNLSPHNISDWDLQHDNLTFQKKEN
jgi:hypothetical protein